MGHSPYLAVAPLVFFLPTPPAFVLLFLLAVEHRTSRKTRKLIAGLGTRIWVYTAKGFAVHLLGHHSPYYSELQVEAPPFRLGRKFNAIAKQICQVTPSACYSDLSADLSPMNLLE